MNYTVESLIRTAVAIVCGGYLLTGIILFRIWCLPWKPKGPSTRNPGT